MGCRRRRSATFVTVRPIGTSPAACRVVTTCRSTLAAARKPITAGIFCAIGSPRSGDIRRISTMCRARLAARATTWRLRAPLGLASGRVPQRPAPGRNLLRRVGRFHDRPLRNRDPQRIATREHDKWHFVPPGGESYESVSLRMREWYEGLHARHCRGCAWHCAWAYCLSRHCEAGCCAARRYCARRRLCVRRRLADASRVTVDGGKQNGRTFVRPFIKRGCRA